LNSFGAKYLDHYIAARLNWARSIARTGVWREVLEFVRLTLPFFGVGRRVLPDGNIGPCPCVLGVDAKPLFQTGFGVRLYRIDRTFGLAHAAIDTLIGVDNEHVLALVKAIYGADLHTIHQLTFDAALVDDIGQ
jgi:hypothetical protein